MLRLILAGILGGIVMFAWGAVFHMFIPIGKGGVKMLPNEEAVMANFKQNVPDAGVYIVPGMANMDNPSAEEQAAWAARIDRGPTAFFVYNPNGRPPEMLRWMGIELASDIVACLVVAFMFLLTGATTFVGRVTISMLIGLTAWLSINISYWNWYRFPKEMIIAEGIDQVVGWLAAGIIIAIFMKPKAA
jgi:hypothetical protein